MTSGEGRHLLRVVALGALTALVALSATAAAACRAKTAAPPTPPAASPAPSNVFEVRPVSASELPADVRRLLAIPTRPGSPRPEVLVGDAPERFPRELVPPGAQIVAAVVTDEQVAVVARSQTFTNKERAGEMQRLLAAGWQWWGPVRSGLLASTSAPVQACRSGQFSSTTFTDSPDGSVLIRVSWTVNPRQPCGASPTNAVFPDVDTPSLLPPAGARAMSSSSGSGPGRTYSTSLIQATLSVEELSDHYVAQMEAAGWKRDGRARDGDQVLITRFSIVSRIGDKITVLLALAPVGGTSHIVSFLMVRNAP